MRKILLAIIGMFLCAGMYAQNSIVGDWMTVDDATGQNFAIVRIYKGEDGLYYGKIHKMLMGGDDLVCKACEGEDAGARILGLVILRGMHMENGELRGGKVLDPNNGKFYYGKVYLKDGKLVLRGSLDKLGVLGRNQTWLPAPKED